MSDPGSAMGWSVICGCANTFNKPGENTPKITPGAIKFKESVSAEPLSLRNHEQPHPLGALTHYSIIMPFDAFEISCI